MSTAYHPLGLVALTVVTLAAGALAQTPAPGPPRIFTGARIPALGGSPALSNAAIVVRDGRIEAVGPTASVARPAGAEVVDMSGKHVIPGIVAAHVHISDIDGVKPRAYTAANTQRRLALFARYGITTVYSLGGEQAPAFDARNANDAPDLARARLLLAGEIVTATTPDAARQAVARVAGTRVDIIKIRVDDNLGSAQKMAPEEIGSGAC